MQNFLKYTATTLKTMTILYLIMHYGLWNINFSSILAKLKT